ncbi:hypothetical protein BsIDN1_08030 [Bacillus safensis]|uniref:Uncharacterized protein n=1 Tax=Bacillus safensis TaxID=561879 RepID=A0A5S9M345_BACIA|nr:hypothetical protein BsIDN1_08030 [Bacillus safensis]
MFYTFNYWYWVFSAIFAAESNSLEKRAIKQHKISGMSDKEITELIKTAKDDRKFAEN